MASITGQLSHLAAGFTGTLGVWARCLQSGETVELNAAESFHPASTIKVAILYELFRQVQSGQARLETVLPVEPKDQVPGAGVLKDLQHGLALSVYNLATLMIIISDNTATNMLIDLVGRENVNAATAALGLGEIHLENKMMLPKPGGPYNRATPRSLGRLMERLARRELLTPDLSDQLLSILRKQQFRDHVTRYLTGDQVDHLTIASKPGEVAGSRNEVAAVWAGDRSYVICMMSKDCSDLRYHPDNEGSLLLPRVARAIHHHFVPVQ